MSINHKTLIWFGLTLMIALAGMASVTYQTRQGPGVSGDSVYYVMGAQNMLSGNGYSRYSGGWEPIPITGFPPVFSLILAGTGFLSSNLYKNGLVLNTLLFGANILLVSLLIFRYTKAVIPALFGALLAMASETMIHYHSWVMTEALFIFFTLLSIYALVRYFENGKLLFLVFAALLMAVSILTRYVGLASVGMAGLGVLFFNHLSWKKRLTHTLILGVVSCTPFILWLYRNSAVSHNLVNRQFIFHLMSRDLVFGFISEAVSWFSPRILHLPRILDASLILLFAGVIPLTFLLVGRRWDVIRKDSSWQGFEFLPISLALFIPAYIILLVANTTLLDAGTTLSAPRRYLLPVYVVIVIMLTCMIYRMVEKRTHAVKIVTLVIGVVFLAFSLSETFSALRSSNKDLGYTDIKHSWTEVVRSLNEIETSHLLISDNVELIYFLAGRPAYAFPISYDNYTQQYRQDYDQQIVLAKARLNEGAIIVFFKPDEVQQEALKQINAVILNEFPQAVFYSKPGQ